MHRIIFLFVFLLTTVRGQIEGKSCVYDSMNTIGYCTLLSDCQTAREDYLQNRIRPIFCSDKMSGDRTICCRDGSNILNSASNSPQDGRPIFPAELLIDRRRISERKCEEYSSNAVKEVTNIPGGKDTKTAEFPHLAAIGWANYAEYRFNCAGSLISSLYVLTAAQCSRDSSAEVAEPVLVRLGDQNIDNSVDDGANRIDVAIRRIIKHPDFQAPKVYNDIALLELVAEVSFNSAIRPVCLWTKSDHTRYRTIIATGWGRINGQISNELQKATLELLDVGFCNETFKSLMNRNFRNGFIDSQICAGTLNGGKVICQGGAPIQVVSQGNSSIIYIVGVTSFGKTCDTSPAVFTRIWSYLDWIESIVWPGQ